MATASFDLVGELAGSVMNAEYLDRYSQLARNFAVDALTAEVAGAFEGDGIETLVFKGPVAKWLYMGEVRPYNDSDLMVAPENRARAVGVLERLGFAEYGPWLPTPMSLEPGGKAFNALATGWWIFTVSCQGSTATRMRSGVASQRALSGRSLAGLSCACPIASWVTVARNIVLALPAVYVALAGPGPSLTSWVASTNATDLWLIAFGALATLTTMTSVLLWRENRRLRSTDGRVATAPRQIGALAPQFALPSAAGRIVSLQDL